jgi:aminopeptidase N
MSKLLASDTYSRAVPLLLVGLAWVIAIRVTPAAEESCHCRFCEGLETRAMLLGRELLGDRQYAPDRQVDVLHIKLDVTPDFTKRTVSGLASITVKPIAKPVSLLTLDAFDLTIKNVRCDGAKLKDTAVTRKTLQLVFAEPIPMGQVVELHIEYSAQPAAGLYFRTPEQGYPAGDLHLWTQGETHEAPHWFPCFDYPNERSTTEVLCHVPKDLTVLSNGRQLADAVDAQGLKVVHWKQEKTHPNYLICLVAGKFAKLEKKHGQIPLGFYTQPSLAEHAENSFRDTERIMAFYENEIGVPFPWPKYDQVTILDFTAGGMENTSLTTLTSNTIFAKATENIRTTQSLDAHELAHQWFGDYVTCKDWSHLWLNEGFATYYTHLYQGHVHGREALQYGLYRDATNRILNQKDDKKPIVYKGYKNAAEQFDYRSYPKGSWVLHMLRSQLGADLYRQCIKAYLEKHSLSSVVSDDLREVFETHSGRTLDQFFDQWLYRPRHPDLKITYKWLLEEQLAKVTIEQTQPVDDKVLLFEFPATLRFVVGGKEGDKSTDRVIDQQITVSKAKEDFYVPLPVKPRLVRFDPEYTILADVTFELPDDMLKAQVQNPADMMGRLLACKALGGRKTHESVQLLEHALNNDPFYGVRITAAEALAKQESDEAGRVLAASWKSQPDARVRLAVVEKMTDRYSERTAKLISTVLEQEKNPAIQAAALKALGRFPTVESQTLLLKYLDSESFRNELADAAIAAIKLHRDPAYKRQLMDALTKHTPRFTPKGLGGGLEALGQIASSLENKADVRDYLLSYLNHPQTLVRTGAIAGLGLLRDPTTEAALEPLADSPGAACRQGGEAGSGATARNQTRRAGGVDGNAQGTFDAEEGQREVERRTRRDSQGDSDGEVTLRRERTTLPFSCV